MPIREGKTAQPRIVLVTPNWHWDSTPLPVETLIVPVTPPLEYSYLYGSLRSRAQIQVIDAYASQMTIEEFERALADSKPSALVVATAPTLLYWRCPPMSVDAARIAIEAIRRITSATITIIGPHGTATPEWALAHTLADWCFRGTPEQDLPIRLTTNDYQASPYMASSERSAVAISVSSNPSLASAHFDWIDFKLAYKPHMWRITDEELAVVSDVARGITMETSRGCPWSCTYCAKEPVRGRYNRRSIEAVRAELERAVKIGADYIYFIDEIFNIPDAGFAQLLELIRDYGIRFGFQGRADLVDEKMARQLASSGCIYAELGIDVISDSLSSRIGRRQELDRAQAGIDVASKHIPIVRFNRINLDTLDYREFFGVPEVSWAFPPGPALPYPGAVLGELVMQRYGYEGFDWDFALHYSWWLRLEVYLQRTQPEMKKADISALQAAFLGLPRTAARGLAVTLHDVMKTPEALRQINAFRQTSKVGIRPNHTSRLPTAETALLPGAS
jgi:hypothetical protein